MEHEEILISNRIVRRNYHRVHGRHAEHDVQVVSHAVDEKLGQVVRGVAEVRGAALLLRNTITVRTR